MKQKKPILLMTNTELLQLLDIMRDMVSGESPLVKITAMERKFKR